jgi:acetyl-CoA carboxylase biotin carboxyl carrier protein
MELKFIQELVNIMNNAGLNLIEIKEKDSSIRLEKSKAVISEDSIEQQESCMMELVEKTETGINAAKGSVITSPMVGVFYAAPSPESAPFVKVGSTIKSGDVLCIIEAMKLMNEITAEQEGIITEICIKNGDVVQFGQPLFYIKSGEADE